MNNNNNYIHLGADVAVLSDEILGVFDLERVTASGITNDFLRQAQKSGHIYYCSLEMPRSFVLAQDKTYITNVSACTIKARFNKESESIKR